MALSQPGIFNVLDYGMVGGESGFPDVNRQALQQAIYAAQAENGGTVLIPTEDLNGNSVYPIYGPIYVGSPTSLSPVAIIIAGTGQGTEDSPTLLVKNNSTLFSVNTSAGGDEHIGGITFQDLSIKYDQDDDGNTYWERRSTLSVPSTCACSELFSLTASKRSGSRNPWVQPPGMHRRLREHRGEPRLHHDRQRCQRNGGEGNLHRRM